MESDELSPFDCVLHYQTSSMLKLLVQSIKSDTLFQSFIGLRFYNIL